MKGALSITESIIFVKSRAGGRDIPIKKNIPMKRFIFLCGTALFFSLAGKAQSGLPGLDKSPMDMCYYPENFPVLKIQDKVTGIPAARVIYSRPKKEGRTIFGGLVAYGEVWRLGANEATEIEFGQPVTIGGTKIAAGRYTLYALVNEASWTFIINKETDTWGAFKYDPAKDIARAEVPVEQIPETVELLAMTFARTNNNTSLVVAWENIKVALPITFN